MIYFKDSEKPRSIFLDVFVICYLLIPIVFGSLTILSVILGLVRLGLASLLVIVAGLWIVILKA